MKRYATGMAITLQNDECPWATTRKNSISNYRPNGLPPGKAIS